MYQFLKIDTKIIKYMKSAGTKFLEPVPHFWNSVPRQFQLVLLKLSSGLVPKNGPKFRNCTLNEKSLQVYRKSSKKCLLNATADIRRWNVEKCDAFFLQTAYARRKILTFFAFQRRKSAIAVSKHFLPFFAVFFYIQQTFVPV